MGYRKPLGAKDSDQVAQDAPEEEATSEESVA
jgi:hypothetical protein